MQKSLYLWNSASAFSAGQWTHLAAEGNALTLARAGESYAADGFYETPETDTPAFTALIVSWNADVPPGAQVEASARVRISGAWTCWYSWGVWSTSPSRAGAAPVQTAGVSLEGDRLQLERGAADSFQLRIALRGAPGLQQPPVVRLLAASLHLQHAACAVGEPLHRSIPVPAYSQAIRNPCLAAQMAGPLAATMLLNRFGQDLLPEEVAHLCRDSTGNRYDNGSFLTAAAACYGFESYACFTDLAGLKQEVRRGYACAAAVRYTNHKAISAERHLPLLDGATGTAAHHFVVVHGFETDENDVEYVLVNDPLASCDDTAARRYRLAQFADAFTGIAYFLHKLEPAPPHVCRPLHLCAELRPSELPGEYALFLHGERHSLPADLTGTQSAPSGTVCYALRDAHAYATTAHKCFFYSGVTPSGNLRLEVAHLPCGTRLTVYLIDGSGNVLAADVKL